MPARDDCLEANRTYQESFDKAELPLPPARGLAVVTCIDARIDPAKVLGLEEGDAHVIRNAGGLVTDDALRSLVISHNLLGTEEVLVIGHTDCGMLTFTDADVQEKLGTDMDFHAFADLEARVAESVAAVRASDLVPDKVTGFVYEVETGRLREVA